MIKQLILTGCALLFPGFANSHVAAQQFYPQCETLKGEGDPEAAVQKQLAALKDKDATTRAQAARQLATACDRRATESLVGLLSDAEPAVRIAAVEALGRLGDREAITPMLELLYKETDWNVKREYATALASFQMHRSSYDVLNVIANPQGNKIASDEEMRTRCYAVLVVNQLRDVKFSRKAVTFLLTWTNHENPDFRKIAVETMSALKETRNGKHELMGILKQNRYPEIQIVAATWLGRLGIEDARYIFEELTASNSTLDPRVQQAIKDATALLDKKQTAEKE